MDTDRNRNDLFQWGRTFWTGWTHRIFTSTQLETNKITWNYQESSEILCSYHPSNVSVLTRLFLSVLVAIGNHQHDYQHSHLDLTVLTPKLGKWSRPEEFPFRVRWSPWPDSLPVIDPCWLSKLKCFIVMCLQQFCWYAFVYNWKPSICHQGN